MPIERLKIKAEVTMPKKDEIPVVQVEGDVVSRYNKASESKNAAEALMKELKPQLHATALPELYRINISSPAAPITSVKVQDEEEAALRISFTCGYSAADPAQVEQVLESMRTPDGKKVDAGKYVQEIIVAKFDSNVFLDAKGVFDQEIYKEFKEAIDSVAAKRKIASPLSTSKVIQPLASFHAQRWALFPSVDQQLKIFSVLPNTVQTVPLKAAEKTNPGPVAQKVDYAATVRRLKPGKPVAVGK